MITMTLCTAVIPFVRIRLYDKSSMRERERDERETRVKSEKRDY